MRRSLHMLIFVGAALLFGWVAGRAQTSTPDFEFIVNAPGGKTSVECVRGCDLKWVERVTSPLDRVKPHASRGKLIRSHEG